MGSSNFQTTPEEVQEKFKLLKKEYLTAKELCIICDLNRSNVTRGLQRKALHAEVLDGINHFSLSERKNLVFVLESLDRKTANIVQWDGFTKDGAPIYNEGYKAWIKFYQHIRNMIRNS